MRCESAEASAVIAVDGAGSAVPKGMGGVGREEELILPLKYDRTPTKTSNYVSSHDPHHDMSGHVTT